MSIYKNKISLILGLLAAAVIVFSCEQERNSSGSLGDFHLESSNESLEIFFNSQFQNWNKDHVNSVFYLILRDCNCVEENIDFIIKNIDLIKSNSRFIIKNPDNSIIWMNLLKALELSNAQFIVDKDGLFESIGHVYASDKVFIKKNRSIEEIEFKNENFTNILNQILNQ